VRAVGLVSVHVEVGSHGTIHVEVGSGGTVCTTACHWSRWTVVSYQLLVDPFEFKFDYLTMNLII
jgi:hypothetical protein